MDPLSFMKDCLSRSFARKWAPIVWSALFLLAFLCGIFFSDTPAFYEFHLRTVDRFLDRVVYSDRSVALIVLSRAAGSAALLALVFAGGVHPVALLLPAVLLSYRAYSFGGTLSVLFSVYGASGAFVAFALFLPVHLLLDVLYLSAASLAVCRAFSFRFCAEELRELCLDLGAYLLLLLLICLLEGILLAVLFHPLGDLL